MLQIGNKANEEQKYRNMLSFNFMLIYQNYNIYIQYSVSISNKMFQARPLKEIFGDLGYAWDLLEYQIKFQLSSQICAEDISKMLQLYMRGVERMNSLTDIRESFFKNRVTSLMSRPVVIKILNKPMSKKSQSPVIESEPTKKIDSKIQIHLQQKRKQMQMRIAYGAQEHNPDNLRKMLAEQNQKQSFLASKIGSIVDSHEERLMKRIRQRKLRTMTAKSRPDVYHGEEKDGNQQKLTKQMLQKKRDEQQFGKPQKIQEGKVVKNNRKRRIKSVSPPRSNLWPSKEISPSKRRVSMDFRGVKVPLEYQGDEK